MARRSTAGARHRTDEHRRTARESTRDALGIRNGLLDERVVVKEIARRVTGDDELRKDDELGAAARGRRRGGDDAIGVACEVADSGVDLGETDPHTTSDATASSRFSAAITVSRRWQTSSPSMNVR